MYLKALISVMVIGCAAKPGADDALTSDALSELVSGEDFHGTGGIDSGGGSIVDNEVCDGIDNDGDGEIDEGLLLTFYIDNDADGWGNEETWACELPPGASLVSGDCDDDDPNIHPEATEVCNEVDDNCNGDTDEGLSQIFYEDRDEDGYGNPEEPILNCALPEGYVDNRDDCDDGASSVSPEATEACNAIDDNCDGRTDEGVGTLLYPDVDGDGYGTREGGVTACWDLDGHTNSPGDCDDINPAINPDADEACDGVDNDCDGEIDEHAVIGLIEYWADIDGDGHGAGDSWSACTVPDDFATLADDCDDHDATRAPSNPEVCNGFDDDCDGAVDEGVMSAFYVDSDGDGYGSGLATLTCEPDDGLVSLSSDCDDSRADVSPAAEEVCDGADNDCDGDIDDDAIDGSTFYADVDGDGFGDPADVLVSCESPAGYVSNYTDCDPSREDVFPGATEYCDDVDNDCDGDIDDDPVDILTWYRDMDGDGFGSDEETIEACEAPDGYVDNIEDCDDSRPEVNPDATESCFTVFDDDCDGTTNARDAEGCTIFYPDFDGDGYGGSTDPRCYCDAYSDWIDVTYDDCDDDDFTVHPDAEETCDGNDEDCDGTVDEDTDDCPCTQFNWGTHSYWFCNSTKKWNGARTWCEARGYALVTVNSGAEQIWLIDMIRDHSSVVWDNYWIGLNDRGDDECGRSRDGWRWASGEAYTYEAFRSGQPDNYWDEDCVEINRWYESDKENDWNDLDCDERLRFICEASP